MLEENNDICAMIVAHNFYQNPGKSAYRKFFGKNMYGTGKQFRNLLRNIPKAKHGSESN